jgi:hypothetical protein
MSSLDGWAAFITSAGGRCPDARTAASNELSHFCGHETLPLYRVTTARRMALNS